MCVSGIRVLFPSRARVKSWSLQGKSGELFLYGLQTEDDFYIFKEKDASGDQKMSMWRGKLEETQISLL